MLHLAKRFFRSLTARKISDEETIWVSSFLMHEEMRLWSQQMRIDQLHSIHIAKRFCVLMPGASREEVAAALLHDVGKIDAHLGVLARVLATILPNRVAQIMPRLGAYVDHEAIGVQKLLAIGSSETTVALVGRTSATKAANALFLADQI